MKIITKYYDKNGKLKIAKNKSKITNSIIRFKTVNKKQFPCCDFHGKCVNKAYAEVYPFAIKNSRKKGWNYLCRKHYYQEQKKTGLKLPASLRIEW